MSLSSKLSRLFEEPQDTESQSVPYKAISERAVKLRIKDKCADYSKTQKIVTSMASEKAGHDYYIYDPEKNEDTYNKNYHLMFMDNLKEWEGYPKRLNAMICFANPNKTFNENVEYVVIPYNGASIGVCPKSKLNDSFGYLSQILGMDFDYSNTTLNLLLNIFNNTSKIIDNNSRILKEKEIFYDKDYATLQNAIARIDSQYHIPEGQKLVEKIINANKSIQPKIVALLTYLNSKNKEKLSDIITKVYSPKNNSFNMKKFSDFVVGENKDNELWINTKCILVKETVFSTLEIEEKKPELPEPEPKKKESMVGKTLEKKSSKVIKKRTLDKEEKKPESDTKNLEAKLGL